jgi:ubiquitin-like modifier-activating enzyme 5
VTPYLGYSSLKDFFPTMEIKPNPGCTNPLCVERQREWAEAANSPEAIAARLAAAEAAATEAAEPLHEDNEWEIEVVPEEEPAGTAGGSEGPLHALAEGLQFSMPVRPAFLMPLLIQAFFRL